MLQVAEAIPEDAHNQMTASLDCTSANNAVEPDVVRNAETATQVAEAVPEEARKRSAALEGVAVRHCRLLLAECLAGSLASPPRLVRSQLLQVSMFTVKCCTTLTIDIIGFTEGCAAVLT